jgi:hypothetical protein
MHCVVLSRPVSPGTVLRDEQNDIALVLDRVQAEGKNLALAVIHDAAAEGKKRLTLSCDEGVIDIELEKRWPE